MAYFVWYYIDETAFIFNATTEITQMGSYSFITWKQQLLPITKFYYCKLSKNVFSRRIRWDVICFWEVWCTNQYLLTIFWNIYNHFLNIFIYFLLHLCIQSKNHSNFSKWLDIKSYLIISSSSWVLLDTHKLRVRTVKLSRFSFLKRVFIQNTP